MQRGRLPGAVGPEDGQHFACADGEFDVDVAMGDDRAHVNIGHGVPPAIAEPERNVRAPSPSTTTTATATNNTDSATAASASVSRCR